MIALQGGGAPQRPRDPRRKRELIPQEKSIQIDGKQINLNIYIPEKFHTTQFKDYREIIEAIKQKKIKWTYDAEYEENYMEELLISGIVSIPKDSVHKVPNDIYSKKRTGKIRSPAKGAKPKQLPSKH